MFNLLTGLKAVIVGILASATLIVSPVNSVIQRVAPGSPAPTPVATQTPSVSPSQNLSPKYSPLPLTDENYIYVEGTYSYIGQSIKYLFLVPRKGGSFSGAVQGACHAQAGGNYEGGNGGKFSGNVGGSCSLFGLKKEGSTGFSGRLYPDTKTVELDIDNSPIHGFSIKYN